MSFFGNLVSMRLLTTLFVLIALSANAQLGSKINSSNNLAGTWQNNQFGYQMTLMLNANGTGEFDGEPVKWSSKPGVLTLTVQSETLNYNYTLNGNSLTVSGGDLDQAITLTKAGTSNENSAPVTNSIPNNQTNNNSASDKSLIGSWNSNGENLEFRSDGTCVYLGNNFRYTASNGQITLSSQQGSANIGYTVNGTQLVLTANGQQLIYNKGRAAAQQSTGGGKRVAPELVGQWCKVNTTNTNSGGSYSSECITLNGNGTYTYSSERSASVNDPSFSGGTNSQGGDRGTWWVEGDRIFYNSQTSGQGSYRLEKRNHPKNVNDPMIVLDGQAFVTQTARAPWR